MPIAKLKGAKRNPKLHDEEALIASVQRHGFVEPIILDERTGRIVAGHGRVQVLKALAERKAKAPTGVGVDDKGVWSVPVVRGWSSENDQEAEAYLVASNRLVEVGGWDQTGLAQILKGLDEAGLQGIGFTSDEVAALLETTGIPSDAGENVGKEVAFDVKPIVCPKCSHEFFK